MTPYGTQDHGRSLITETRRTLELSRALIDLSRARLDETSPAREPTTPDGVPPAAAGAGLRITDLPQPDPVMPDLVIAGRYLPAGVDGEPLAGDFYDLIQAGSDRHVLVVGDVTGHGPTAHPRMQALRTATRAIALTPVGPQRALATLDRFLDQQPDDWLATLWYAEYTPSTGRLTYASAGHPPPVLVTPGQPAQLLQIADAPPLGVGVAHALAREHQVHLPPGAVLTAYSDGLIERHDADLTDQLRVLLQTVNTHADPARHHNPQQLADAVLAALLPDPTTAGDDVCLMIVYRRD